MQGELLFAFQAAIVVICAKFAGRFFERKLGQPSVIGEVAAGLAIGPFALGGLSIPAGTVHLPLLGGIRFPGLGPLFPLTPSGAFDPGLLQALTIVGAVVLMFDAGLETNLKKFLAYAPAGLAAGLGGAVLSFVLGAASVVWAGRADSLTDPVALVLGAVATATSVGLTVRVLSDARKLNSPEGSTILSAAVIDDVIGLVFLSLVFAMGSSFGTSPSMLREVAIVVGKAVVVFCGLLLTGILLKKRISRLLLKLGSLEAAGAAALATALLGAGVAEASGLALIVGAYVIGLSLSETDMVHVLHNALAPIREMLVPVVFCVTGMMADLGGVGSMLGFGLAYTLLISAGKIIGCGLPSLAFGFNLRGAVRIGVGMLPRQEVGLIAASLALSRGLIGPGDMAVVILMVLITAVATPPAIARLFRTGSGQRRALAVQGEEQERVMIPFPQEAMADFFVEGTVSLFVSAGYFAFRMPVQGKAWDLRKDDTAITLSTQGRYLVVTADKAGMNKAIVFMTEHLSQMKTMFSQLDSSDEESIRRIMYGLESGGGPEQQEDW